MCHDFPLFLVYQQHQYLGNINAFLSVCKKNFGIPESELFKDLELYDVANFSKVDHSFSTMQHRIIHNVESSCVLTGTISLSVFVSR